MQQVEISMPRTPTTLNNGEKLSRDAFGAVFDLLDAHGLPGPICGLAAQIAADAAELAAYRMHRRSLPLVARIAANCKKLRG